MGHISRLLFALGFLAAATDLEQARSAGRRWSSADYQVDFAGEHDPPGSVHLIEKGGKGRRALVTFDRGVRVKMIKGASPRTRGVR